jgi:hypothetical protein
MWNTTQMDQAQPPPARHNTSLNIRYPLDFAVGLPGGEVACHRNGFLVDLELRGEVVVGGHLDLH